jgi:cobalt-zinc-cadmium efflux system outer membrane protein
MLVVLTLATALAAQPAPPPTLTLAQAVAQARATSPLRHAARYRALGSTDAALLAGRRLNPLVDVRVENFGAVSRSSLPLDVYALVSQPFELAGKRGLRREIAGAERDVASADLLITDWQLTRQTVQLYIQALRARGLLDTLTANRDGLSTLIDTMRRRVEEGVAAESDLLKFETESARMDIDIARAGLGLEHSLNALTYIMGASAPVTSTQLVEPSSVGPPRLDAGGITEAIARHPEVTAATARVARARQTTALERARRVPDPLVTAGYKRTAGFDTAVAGVTMTLPVFDRNGAVLARLQGEERAAEAERDALALRLTSEATSLIATAQALSERATRAVPELLEPADVVRNAARAAFREGATDVLRLIDAERVYGDVRRTALELRLDALSASLEARFAIGEETLP